QRSEGLLAPDTVRLRNATAEAYIECGQTDSASELFEELIRSCKAKNDADAYANSIGQYADFLVRSKHYHQAASMFAKELAVRRSIKSAPIVVATNINNLTFALGKSGKIVSAGRMIGDL